jgi:hypothetical protein
MNILYPAFFAVFGFAASAVLLGWVYFRRYEISRLPVGVLGLGDVAVMIGAIVVLPYLYLGLPLWLVVAIFALGVLSILYFTVEPILRARWATWVVTLTLLGIDIWAQIQFGATSTHFLLVNNAVLVVSIVGATNLWVQSGMKVRDVAVLAGFLTLYDLVATSLLPLTSDLITRLASIPLAPLVAWGAGNEGLAMGLGDLLLATLFPLVMRKAFGRAASIVAMVTTLGVSAVMMALLMLVNLTVTLPAMTALGPLMVLQYVYWVRKRGEERTTWQYLQAEPLSRRRTASD